MSESDEVRAVELRYWRCPHEVAEYRTRIRKDGVEMVSLQCMRCGQQKENYIKREFWPKVRPLWDDSISEKCKAEVAEDLKKIRLSHARNRQKEALRYEEYLNSPEWRELRLVVLDRDKWLCQGCLAQDATEVHHLTYDHIYEEFLFELISVCGPCHRRFHGKNEDGLI